MPTQLKVKDVELAMIAALKANAPLTALGAQVGALSSNQCDAARQPGRASACGADPLRADHRCSAE